MSQGTSAKVAPRSAAEVCRRFELGTEARGLLREEMTPRQFLDLLIAGRHHADAGRFLAHVLPKREAVWWACQCVEREQAAVEPPASAALEAAKAWVLNPTDANRRAAWPSAEAAGIGTPHGCVAAAAYFSGGSLAPPDLPAAPPPEPITAQLVAGAVALAAVAAEPEKALERYADFFKLGIDVANGKNSWTPAKK